MLRKPDDSPWRPETPGAVVCASTGERRHDSSRSRWGKTVTDSHLDVLVASDRG